MNKYKKVSNSNTSLRGKIKTTCHAYWRETTSFLTRAFCISLVYGLLPLLRGGGVCFFILVGLAGAFSQNVGVNATGSTPHISAGLDVDFNNKGLLVPRLTTAQRNAIATPAESLLIYNTTTQCFEAWNNTTTSWVAFGCIGCQLPGAFTASSASGITATTFASNCVASASATTYYLDVATDAAFTSYVSGYTNLNVGNVLTANVTGLTCATTYYYRVRANNTCGTSANSNAITVVAGSCASQIAYTTPGSYNWVCPAGVTSVSVVCVGGGGGGWNGQNLNSRGGGAGGLGYKNNITVVPGNNYTVVVGGGASSGGIGGDSYFINSSTVAGIGGQGDAVGNPSRTSGGGYVGDGGGNGGNGGPSISYGGGGGAGGYTGNGGNGGSPGATGSGGGGGGADDAASNPSTGYGGGVGILGQGANGVGGSVGGGGSGGETGYPQVGGLYGGGSYGAAGSGGSGAVRIIWPGTVRQFPSTGTADQ